MIYLAAPYSHELKRVKRDRYRAVSKAAAILMKRGEIVFSPISMTHPMAVYGDLPGDWLFWEKFDCEFLTVCDRFLILELEGWMVSKGVMAELDLARRLKKNIGTLTPAELGIKDVPVKGALPGGYNVPEY